MKDPQQDLVYAAEDPVRRTVPRCASWREAQRFVDTVTLSTWFTRRFGFVRVEVCYHKGLIALAEQPNRRIYLPHWALSHLIILHELAHIVSPSRVQHGFPFCSNYLFLVRHVLGPMVARVLRKKFQAHKVKITRKAA